MHVFTLDIQSGFTYNQRRPFLKKTRKPTLLIAALFFIAFLFQPFNLSAQIEIGGGGSGCPTYSSFPVFTLTSGQQSFDLAFTVTGGRGNTVTATFSTNPALSWISMATVTHSSSLDIHLEGNAPVTNKNLFYPATIQINTSGCSQTLQFTLAVQAAPIPPVAGGILFVTPTGAGNFSGISWVNATNDLQAAINAASGTAQVYVKEGTYYPIRRADGLTLVTPNDRNNAFVLKKDVKIVGGFAGTGGQIGSTSILSGDIGTVSDNSDNAYHVLVSAGDAGAAELNRFTITGGNANIDQSIVVNGFSIAQRNGAGISMNTSSPIIKNTIVSSNEADLLGGGIFLEASSPVLNNLAVNENSANSGGGIGNNNGSAPSITNVAIRGNSASSDGGGMYNFSSSPVITNVLISGNSSRNAGGAMFNYNQSSPILTNVTISGNYNPHSLDGIYNFFKCDPIIRNSVIYDELRGVFNYDLESSTIISYSMVEGLFVTTDGNISSIDPLLVYARSRYDAPFTDGNYQLQAESYVINRGNSAYYDVGQTPDLHLITTDLNGNPRAYGGAIDLGAFENQLTVLSVSLVKFTAKAENTTAKIQWSTATETNNKEFVVSHSVDGQIFTEIGKVVGAGNSASQKGYVFYDKNPVNGVNYYRLQQVDFDGRVTSHGIRKVDFSFAGTINVYPSPVTDMLKIEFSEGNYQHIQLVDNSGKVLQELRVGITDSQKTLHLKNLPSGAYYIRFIGNGKMEVRKVVKE